MLDGSPLRAEGFESLVAEVAERLWALVKHGRETELSPAPLSATWRPPRLDDFRFVNLAALGPDHVMTIDPESLSQASLLALLHQFVALHRRDAVLPDEVPLVEAALRARSLPALIAFFADRPRVPVIDEQPVSMLCLS